MDVKYKNIIYFIIKLGHPSNYWFSISLFTCFYLLLVFQSHARFWSRKIVLQVLQRLN